MYKRRINIVMLDIIDLHDKIVVLQEKFNVHISYVKTIVNNKFGDEAIRNNETVIEVSGKYYNVRDFTKFYPAIYQDINCSLDSFNKKFQ